MVKKKMGSPQSQGGLARSESLSASERSSIAKKAAEKRWKGIAASATHVGDLQIAGSSIQCAVLEDGRRVLTQETFLTAIGRSSKGKGGQIMSAPDGLPPFLSALALKPFITEDLRKATVPVIYKTTTGGRAFGYEASLLPQVCEIYLKARDEGRLTSQQQHIAKACELLMRGLAHIGIIALVDEATGYQYDRARTALADILEAFIKDELGKWARRFPDDFYRHMFRLKGVEYQDIAKRPRYFGVLTNNIVYRRLAPGVLEELKRVTPKDSKGRRKHHFHRRLTEDVGHPKLQEHLASVITVMRLANNWEEFMKLLDRTLPVWRGDTRQKSLPGM